MRHAFSTLYRQIYTKYESHCPVIHILGRIHNVIANAKKLFCSTTQAFSRLDAIVVIFHIVFLTDILTLSTETLVHTCFLCLVGSRDTSEIEELRCDTDDKSFFGLYCTCSTVRYLRLCTRTYLLFWLTTLCNATQWK